MYDHDLLEEVPLFVHQVESIGSKLVRSHLFMPLSRSINPSFVTVFLYANAAANIMTEEIMHQLGLILSQPNAKGGFAKGVIKDLEVAFDSCPSYPFYIDVMVVDALNNWGIILHKDLIKHLARIFQDQESKAIIPHPEGGLFTLHKEPLVGSSVETFDEFSDQILCIDNDVDN
jgi:hypothetical protein